MKIDLFLRSGKIQSKETMLIFFQKNWFHILIWVSMLVYLILAPNLYVQFILKRGKPIQGVEGRPVDSNQIKFTIDGLSFHTVEGQDIYILSGWAFSVLDRNVSPDMYDRAIVLASDTKTYFFPIETVYRKDVQDTYKDLSMNLVGSGFKVFISKDVIQQGEYRIGIIFKNSHTGLAYFSDKPARYIVRSPNRLSYSE